jgi:hypothetical protein
MRSKDEALKETSTAVNAFVEKKKIDLETSGLG